MSFYHYVNDQADYMVVVIALGKQNIQFKRCEKYCLAFVAVVVVVVAVIATTEMFPLKRRKIS